MKPLGRINIASLCDYDNFWVHSELPTPEVPDTVRRLVTGNVLNPVVSCEVPLADAVWPQAARGANHSQQEYHD